MGKEFDWNKFETKKEVFDWSQFESTPSSPKEDLSTFSMKGLARGFTEAIPIATGIGGGIVGSALGPIGTIGGSALGAGLGESVKNLIKQKVFDEAPKSIGENIKDIATATASGAMAEMGGQVLGKALTAAPGALSKAGKKIGEALTGVPEKEIATYAKEAKAIKEMAKASDNSTIEAADQIRSKFQESIQGTRKALNSSLDEIIQSGSTPGKPWTSVDSRPIIESLNKARQKINPLNDRALKEIDGEIAKIVEMSNNGGPLTLKEANDVKRYLQDAASSAYSNQGIFQGGSEFAKAAKSGAATARQLLDEAAPEIKDINKKLSRLHDIEDALNINLIIPGKPEAALLAAGSGGNPRNAKLLSDLGEQVGTDMLGEAEKLAAMRTFGSPKLMAADVTGKSAARIGAATGLGAVAGGVPGAVIGGALTSPLALRTAIDTGRALSPLAKKIAPLASGAIQGAARYEGQTAIQRRLNELLNNLGGQ